MASRQPAWDAWTVDHELALDASLLKENSSAQSRDCMGPISKQGALTKRIHKTSSFQGEAVLDSLGLTSSWQRGQQLLGVSSSQGALIYHERDLHACWAFLRALPSSLMWNSFSPWPQSLKKLKVPFNPSNTRVTSRCGPKSV